MSGLSLLPETLLDFAARWNRRPLPAPTAVRLLYRPVAGDDVWVEEPLHCRLHDSLASLSAQLESPPRGLVELVLRLHTTPAHVYIELWLDGSRMRRLRCQRARSGGCLHPPRGRETPRLRPPSLAALREVCALSPDPAWLERLRLATGRLGRGTFFSTSSLRQARQWSALHPYALRLADTAQGAWSNSHDLDLLRQISDMTGKNFVSTASSPTAECPNSA